MLKLEEGTMLFENADKYRFPSEDDVIEMTGICGDRLSDSGIERYEISNYAKQGYEQCNLVLLPVSEFPEKQG